MPSTTRGSILISTANDIGEALVEKLGGVGYSPNDWKNNINLCGIAPVDSAPALSVLADSAGTGDERGSILIATADAIGAILNKKYNVLRGFKPKEWASATSKLAPLPERTATGSIATFSDGADEVPIKSWEVTLPASLDGYSSVDVVGTGKNLFNYEAVEAFNAGVIITRNDGDYTVQNNNSYGVGAFRGISFHLKPSSYSLSLGEALSAPIRIYKNGSWFNNGINAGGTSCTFTVTEEANYDFSCNVPANSSLTIKKCQFEVGSTATAYEPYTAPTQYTADLGRTIYGGTADVVNGTGTATIDENGDPIDPPEPFTFTPITPTPETALGVNNFWADEGDSEVEYYAEQEPYTRKTATGGIANFSDQRTDLPLTKAIANIAPSIAGKSAVNLYQGSEQYQPTTTYTAELGETVYGGSVDFVSGEVVKDCTKDSMSSSYLSGLSLDTYIGYEASTAYFGGHPSIWVRNWNYQTAAPRTAGGIKCTCNEFPASMNNTTIFSTQYRIYFDVNGKNISSVQDFIDYVENLEQNGKQLEITYEIATPTESAIPGRVISPIEGVNNYWNDAGGDTEIQYFEDET